jgi:RND family efflux transporter MFP subunit
MPKPISARPKAASMNEARRPDDHKCRAVTGRRRRSVVYIAIIALTAAGLAGGMAAVWAALRHRQPDDRRTIGPTPALTVTVARPVRAIWPITLEASGAIAAWQEASIGAQVGGYRLVEVSVNVGDQVTKDQVLARFDSALLQADEARLKANDVQAKANEERMLRLQKSGTVSDRDVLQFVTQAKTADALLESNRLQLRYTEVLASDDGVISSRTATLGAVVPVGQELFRLIRQNRLEWRGEVTAAQLTHVEIGQQAKLTLPGGGEANATIRQTAPSLDPQTRLGIVYADIAPGSRARAGMYVDGRVVLGQVEALIVPAESVTIRDGRNYVLKLMDASATPRVSLRPVTVRRRRGNYLEIVDGVEHDDRLVVAGAGFLNEGDFVRVTDINDTDRTAPSP